MTSILERAIQHAQMRNDMSAAEVNDLIARDVDQPITGDEFARLLASGAFKSAGSANLKAGIKHAVSDENGSRVHKVVLEDNYATEDFV
jgi:hypothetical protein